MNYRCLSGGALAALAFGTLSYAQGIGSLVVPEQSFTTGMIGFTTNQTARLNVLNLSTLFLTPNAASPAAATCTVQLAFYDTKGNVISQTMVQNFAAGTSTSFDLPRATVTSEPVATTARAEIRGVVTVNPTTTPPTSTSAVSYCTVKTTLEIYDATGSTVALTSDTTATHLSIVVPVTAGAN